MGQIRPSLGKGSNATIPRHMGFSTPICRRAVSDPFCIFFPMMIFWKIKVNYVYLANFKLESGLRIRVTILDRRRRQRVNICNGILVAALLAENIYNILNQVRFFL